MVDEDVEGVDLVIEIRGLGDFLRGDRNCIGDVGESPGGEGAGLGKGGDRDASEGVCSLDPCRLHALVGFDVGSETNAEPPCLFRHPRRVALETIKIDQRARCREIVNQHADRVTPDEPQRHRGTEGSQRFFGLGVPVPERNEGRSCITVLR